ncbi:phosphoribosylanthranilate isomerase [Sulfurospirillum sp. 1612]|uniref:phosphoribosylanthranilate isomerase n=1 Tax=Sulfurospirillum sp. 1612 TaxID=3094835 RepID=UPI002F93CD9D
MTTPRVKICGITNIQDALHAVQCGADALGFVFYEKSPRYIAPEKAAAIIKKLPPFVEKVGLFVNETAETINQRSQIAQITLAQIHFDADVAFFERLTIPHLKVVRARCPEDMLKYHDEYRLVDAFVEGYGGQGKRVDPSWFQGIACSKIILAGGLNTSNIAELKAYDFYGFDASSSLERAPGLKDAEKIKEFLQKAKQKAGERIAKY